MASASFQIKSQTRCLVSHADDAHHGFLTASNNLRGTNEIRLLRYSEEDDEVRTAALYSHKHEVSSLSACPTDASLVATVYNTVPSTAGSVWRLRNLPSGEGDVDGYAEGLDPQAQELEQVAEVPQVAGTRLHHVHFSPAGEGRDGTQLAAVYGSCIRVLALRPGASSGGSGAAAATVAHELPVPEMTFVGGIAWDPHHASELAVACDSSVAIWDVRAGDKSRAIDHAVPPGACVRAVTYNPNKPWYLASAGDDYVVKAWDLRKPTAPVRMLEGHTHWVTSVAFNPFHDQLLLSGGSDARVCLWRVSSISSAPLLELGEDDEEEQQGGKVGGAGDAAASAAALAADITGESRKKAEPKLAPDAAVRVLDEHDDSVQAVAWSVSSAWVFAALSYTGKLLVSQVPSAEKYKILL